MLPHPYLLEKLAEEYRKDVLREIGRAEPPAQPAARAVVAVLALAILAWSVLALIQ